MSGSSKCASLGVFREDLFAPGASYCTGRIVDILSLKRRVPTFTLIARMPFIRHLSWMTWWYHRQRSI